MERKIVPKSEFQSPPMNKCTSSISELFIILEHR